MSEGKDVEALSRRVKKALEVEMDEAAKTRLRTWFIH
jgi:16S rRNA G966 N2-methylase RsmD